MSLTDSYNVVIINDKNNAFLDSQEYNRGLEILWMYIIHYLQVEDVLNQMGINSQTRNGDSLMKFIKKDNGLCKLYQLMY